jgi:two-component system cell cycle response regulator DivK
MSLILIVEDNDKNLKLVRDVLQVKGYQTIEAGTAEDGIELARERKPDLVLMDIQLPGMNGIDALKVLRADASTAGIPVIAVTASVMQQDRNLITEAGFDGYHRQADQPQGVHRHGFERCSSASRHERAARNPSPKGLSSSD